MKNLITALLVIAPFLCFAQSGSKMKMYTIHEDRVKPSMVGEYESLIKELVSLLKEHSIEDGGFKASVTVDFTYRYVSPINSMGDLDKSLFATLSEKAGKEKVDGIFKKLDKCYDEHGTYIIKLDEDLSYQPGGIDPFPQGQNWREYHFWHFAPSNLEAAAEKAKKIKEFFTSKGSPVHYRVYRSGFGTVGNYFMVAFAAPDAVTFSKGIADARASYGDEYKKLIGELRRLTMKYEEVSGMIREDLSYVPVKKAGAGAK
jgi:hypothetical protein